MYTDEGISGVSTRHRDGFNEMVADALAGKIEKTLPTLIQSYDTTKKTKKTKSRWRHKKAS